MQLGLNADQAELLAEVEAFLADWRAGPDSAATRAAWFRAVCERGWSVPAWPARWGGAGLSVELAYLVDRTLVLAGAPVLTPLIVAIIGPLLMRVAGSRACRRWLPDLARGESRWCVHGSVLGGQWLPGSFKAGAPSREGTFLPAADEVAVPGAGRADHLMALATDGRQAAPVVAGLPPEAVLTGTHLDPDRVITRRLHFRRIGAKCPEPALRALVDGLRTSASGRACSQVSRLRRRLDEIVRLSRDPAVSPAFAELGVKLTGLAVLEERALQAESDALTLALTVGIAEAGQALASLAMQTLGYYALPVPDPVAQHNELPLAALSGQDAVGDLIRYVGGLEAMSARDRIASLVQQSDQRRE